MTWRPRIYLTGVARWGVALALALFAFEATGVAAQSAADGIADEESQGSVQLAVLPGAMNRADMIRDSAHDLTTSNESSCSYCHTFSMASGFGQMKWSRQPPAARYIMYTSPTIDMTIASQPQGVSLVCLSCHDGTVAFDQIGNPGNGSLNGRRVTGKAAISNDLSDDHPISVSYSPSRDPNFNVAVNGHVGDLPLYGAAKDQVECATCHNPHDGTHRSFLRVVNARSGLCMTCHIR